MRNLLVGVLLLLSCLASVMLAQSERLKEAITEDETAIYRAVFSSFEEARRADVMLVAETTALRVPAYKSEPANPRQSREYPIWAACLAGSEIENASSTGGRRLPAELLTFAKTAFAKRRTGEPATFRGELVVSDIIFNQEKTYAVVSYSWTCGALCGHGETQVFQKTDGQWRQRQRLCEGWAS